MTVLTAARGKREARDISRAAFRVEFLRDWKQAAARWNDVTPSTPFQDSRWLEAWYEAFADSTDVQPLIAIVTDAATGELAALLPLILRPHKGIRLVEFADLALTDYNAPLLGEGRPRDAAAARTLWRDLTAALSRLPDGCDLIRLRKMPAELGQLPNPLALVDGAGPCPLNGNVVTTGDDFDAWRHSLEKAVRKELERSWRVFTRDPAATFKIVTDKNERLRMLSAMELQQGTRMQHLGLNFVLNGGACTAFYRRLVGAGVSDGYAVVSALTVGEEVVATLLGIRSGSRYVMVRISHAGEKWSNCSPGRLVIERTMAALHAHGVREFDFSVGNYAYKRRFGVRRIALVDLSAALSWRGMPHALRDRAVRALNRHPRLAGRIKRALGRAPTREEE